MPMPRFRWRCGECDLAVWRTVRRSDHGLHRTGRPGQRRRRTGARQRHYASRPLGSLLCWDMYGFAGLVAQRPPSCLAGSGGVHSWVCRPVFPDLCHLHALCSAERLRGRDAAKQREYACAGDADCRDVRDGCSVQLSADFPYQTAGIVPLTVDRSRRGTGRGGRRVGNSLVRS